ncbi:hypothetical protein [Oceanicaulis alexandrii]|uniref:hypothetical protein n=1 Tax=Oceanicaulis alexandrii TaxID=153233 RepID=UPI003B501968|tara:strand:- start:121 stop:429 length:309 start_codon:yes stop_codon:yes gene_type:complete
MSAAHSHLKAVAELFEALRSNHIETITAKLARLDEELKASRFVPDSNHVLMKRLRDSVNWAIAQHELDGEPLDVSDSERLLFTLESMMEKWTVGRDGWPLSE